MNSENHDLCKSAGFNLDSPGVCRFFLDQDHRLTVAQPKGLSRSQLR